MDEKNLYCPLRGKNDPRVTIKGNSDFRKALKKTGTVVGNYKDEETVSKKMTTRRGEQETADGPSFENYFTERSEESTRTNTTYTFRREHRRNWN